jgi:hypothetical protein
MAALEAERWLANKSAIKIAFEPTIADSSESSALPL